MKFDHRSTRIFVAGCLATAGTALTTGCDNVDVQAIATGAQVVADALAQYQTSQNNDINFGDWLLSELD